MKKTIIFMVTNGAGLGHLTRGLAVAKKLRQLDSTLEIVFFSTSLATEVIRNEGFMFYYIPSKSLMPETVTASVWNDYMKKQLQQIVDIYDPVAIVFDGAHPYGGIISNIRQNRSLTSIWIRREGYKRNTPRQDYLEKNFHLTIVPKELVRIYDEDRENESTRKYCKPIVLLDSQEVHDRDTVRKALGITPEDILFYVQLGAGNINDIREAYEIIIKCILKNPNHIILLGESIIGEKTSIASNRVKIIRSYPNAQYFKGIDFAISAVGYNTFHELLYFKVPTLFVPNLKTLQDDQVKRAKLAEEKGAALCLEEISEADLDDAIKNMCSQKENMKQNIEKIHQENGSEEAARYILLQIRENPIRMI